MSDTVTIIVSATNSQIVKSFGGGDYQPLKFSPGSEFLVCQQPVHDLQSLASIISGLQGAPTKAVIRGLPLLPENEPVARQSQNFSSISHHWCMIDIDSLPWDGDLQDQKAMLEYASFHLPPDQENTKATRLNAQFLALRKKICFISFFICLYLDLQRSCLSAFALSLIHI